MIGDVRLNGFLSPLYAWEDWKTRDMIDCSWLSQFLTFRIPPLFPAEEDEVHLTDREYREAMLRKVAVVSHRASLEISRRIRGHIDELIDGLSLLGNSEEFVDSSAHTQFEQILSALT